MKLVCHEYGAIGDESTAQLFGEGAEKENHMEENTIVEKSKVPILEEFICFYVSLPLCYFSSVLFSDNKPEHQSKLSINQPWNANANRQ